MLFLVASFSALSMLCGGVVLLLRCLSKAHPGMISVQPPGNLDVVSDGVEPSNDVPTCVVDVKTDGTVLLEGESLTIDELVIRLRHDYVNERLNVNLRSDARTEYVVVIRVFDQLRRIGVEEISIQVGQSDQK